MEKMVRMYRDAAVCRSVPERTAAEPCGVMERAAVVFFACSVAGWCWEVLYALMAEGRFVNRGVLLGPWLPIYGVGALLILALVKPGHVVKELLGIMLLCGALEYGVSWGLEALTGLRYWDYSGFLLNIHGRVCLEGLLAFGLGGLGLTRFLAPGLERLAARLHPLVRRTGLAVLGALFGLDLIWSALHL